MGAPYRNINNNYTKNLLLAGQLQSGSFPYVGRILDLVLSQSESGEKIIPREFPPGFHAFPPLKVCGIVRYDDLLLPMHRWFAQIAIGASDEHFGYASTVAGAPARPVPSPFLQH